jgi:hypothetical protein
MIKRRNEVHSFQYTFLYKHITSFLEKNQSLKIIWFPFYFTQVTNSSVTHTLLMEFKTYFQK